MFGCINSDRKEKFGTLMNMNGTLFTFSKCFQVIAIIIAISFVSVVFVGMFTESFAPQINSNERTCLFDWSQECSETVSEHTAQWQQTFDNVPNNLFVVLIILLAFLAAVLTVLVPTNATASLHEEYTPRILLNARRDKFDKLFNYILQAFSNGILHPKLF